ncbi:AMP-binding protein [Candidatus Solincola sp.]|nr:AMP-binding protein [Actinomycetota bacterium]MDI7252345.1 AMP-binding protein [Actinomycetota bacterium]
MEAPWFQEYRDVGIPVSLEPYPEVPTHYFLDRAAERFPGMGCVQLGLELSYADIKEKADRLAGVLRDMGVGKGDRVATMLPTSIQFVIADAAVSKAGAVHMPCSFLEARDTLLHKFREGTPKVLICLDEHLETAEYLRLNFKALHQVVVSNVADFSELPPEKTKGGEFPQLLEVLEDAEPRPLGVDINPAQDLETLLFTGGTTGVPKGCMLTHRNIVANALQSTSVYGRITKVLEGNMAVLMGLPFFHSYGHCMMHTMIQMGATLLLVIDPRDTRSMLQMIREYHPIMQIGVPTQFMKMLQEDLKNTRIIGISGSAALPPTVQEEFEKASGSLISEGYGLSEMSPVTHFNISSNIRLFGGRAAIKLNNVLLFNPLGIALNRGLIKLVGYKRFGELFTSLVSFLTRFSGKSRKLKSMEKRGSIGIPVPDTLVKVVDPDTGKELSWEEMVQQGMTGEMLLSGPQRMLGYWPQPGSGMDEDGYIHTGDIVRMDEKGYFSVVDRTKDMVNVSGYKVYTREIDDILYEHEATALAATIGVPDPARPGSELVKVFIQLKPEYVGKVTENDYFKYLSQRVAKYARPRSIVIVDEMPLTEVYKVNKKLLREQEIRKMQESQAQEDQEGFKAAARAE